MRGRDPTRTTPAADEQALSTSSATGTCWCSWEEQVRSSAALQAPPVRMLLLGVGGADAPTGEAKRAALDPLLQIIKAKLGRKRVPLGQLPPDTRSRCRSCRKRSDPSNPTPSAPGAAGKGLTIALVTGSEPCWAALVGAGWWGFHAVRRFYKSHLSAPKSAGRDRSQWQRIASIGRAFGFQQWLLQRLAAGSSDFERFCSYFAPGLAAAGSS